MDETADLFDLLYVYSPEELAAFESGSFWDFPGWNFSEDSFNFADPGAFGGELFDPSGGRWVDTTTGEILTGPQAQAIDAAAWTASYEREFGLPPSDGEPFGAEFGDVRILVDENGDPVRDAFGKATLLGPDGNPPTEESWLGWISRVGGLDTAAGRMLWTLALGAAGVGISQALTPSRKLTLPSIPPNPVQQAGQRQLLDTIFSTSPDPVAAIRQAYLSGQLDPASTAAALRALGVVDPEALVQSFSTGGGLTGTAALRAAISGGVAGQAEAAEALRQQAERARVAGTQMAPIQDLIRSLGIAQVPEQIATPEPFDLVGGGIRARVIKALLGEEVDPALERRITDEREVLLNKLAKMYGRPGQETEGTVGGALAQGFDTRANELRYAVNRDILSLLAPQEQARTAYQAERRDTRLGQNVAMSGFGLVPPAQTAESLRQMMPIQPLLGIDDTSGEKTAQLAAQAAIAQFNAQGTADQQQAAAIARLFGTAAGSLTTPTYNFTMANPSAWALS